MKDFIIIGNTNAVTYKEVFPLFKANKVRLGYSTVKTFNTKDGTKDFGNVVWFVTFPVEKKPLVLSKTYNPEDYPKYDNYDAINVNRVEDIPYDYDGVMGVPVSFLAKCEGGFVIEDKLNSPVIGGGAENLQTSDSKKKLEIVGLGIANLGLECGVRPYLPEHKFYRKYVQKRGTFDGDLYLLDNNGHPVVPYARILIRKVK